MATFLLLIANMRHYSVKRSPITQEHGSGCAVACVGFILNRSYQDALNLFSKPHQAWGRGFYCQEIVNALRNAGQTYSYCHLNIRKKHLLMKANIIVFMGRSKEFPIGHFLTKSDYGNWMNPWSNYPIIAPAKSAFQKRLPEKPIYVIYPV